MPEPIKCKVEECHFNDNFICQAEQIEVRSSGDPANVSTSDDTACETFRLKS